MYVLGKNMQGSFNNNNSDLLHEVNKVIDANENNLVIYIKNVMKKNLINKFAPFHAYEVIVNEAAIGTMYKKNKNKYFKKLHEAGAEFV